MYVCFSVWKPWKFLKAIKHLCGYFWENFWTYDFLLTLISFRQKFRRIPEVYSSSKPYHFSFWCKMVLMAEYWQRNTNIMQEFQSKRSSLLNAKDGIGTKPMSILLQDPKVPKFLNNQTRGNEISASQYDEEPRDLSRQSSRRIGSEDDNASIMTLRPMSIKRSLNCSQNASQPEPRIKKASGDRTIFQMTPPEKTCVCVIL